LYAGDVEPEIVCKQTAYRHGVTLADIRWAFVTAEYDLPIEGDEEKRLLIGFNIAGNPLEILYNELDDGRLNVFHAMPCRKIYAALLKGKE
jgi:hypothetical protein